MAMPIEKAEKVLGAWRDNNYNARKALKSVGYSDSMATKCQNRPINSALKAVAKSKLKAIAESKNPRDIQDIVGMSVDEIIGHYRFIIEQNKDLTNKLKALQPLLATQGIKWNEEEKKSSQPLLNITVKDNNITPKDTKDTGTINLVAVDK